MKNTIRIFAIRMAMIAALIGCIRPGTLHSQDTISFTPNGLSGMPDTAFAGDSILVGVYLKNYSTSQTFADSIRIDGYVDTGLVVPFSIPYYYLYQSWSLAPQDSEFFLIPFSFNTGLQGGKFHVGNNVVVVWPVAQSSLFGTGDSIAVNVFLIDTINSIDEEINEAQIHLYPVPSNGPLYINSYHPQIRIISVVIRDSQGKEVYRREGNDGPIETQSWAPGVYTVETIFSNGTSGHYKILRN